MPKGIHFDIAADDPEKAVTFYHSVFGWQINKFEGPMDYWLVTAGSQSEPGIDGGIGKRSDRVATGRSGHIIITFSVPSVDEYIERIRKAGGNVLMAKAPIPGVGYIAYCTDAEGNEFGILEADPSARIQV
ncbi:MAG TPA: VOC family protein [Methanoregulaceae archaeon]|nr:VOC family protein [Methanoregulaceae archaeon]